MIACYWFIHVSSTSRIKMFDWLDAGELYLPRFSAGKIHANQCTMACMQTYREWRKSGTSRALSSFRHYGALRMQSALVIAIQPCLEFQRTTSGVPSSSSSRSPQRDCRDFPTNTCMRIFCDVSKTAIRSQWLIYLASAKEMFIFNSWNRNEILTEIRKSRNTHFGVSC